MAHVDAPSRAPVEDTSAGRDEEINERVCVWAVTIIYDEIAAFQQADDEAKSIMEGLSPPGTHPALFELIML